MQIAAYDSCWVSVGPPMGLSGPRNLIEIINPSVETRPLITPFFYDMQLGIGYESIKQGLLSQKNI